MKPEISVYLPTFNRLPLLIRAVNSLTAQTFKNFEVIIVDDGSSDGTKDYLSGLNSTDPRFRPIEKTKEKRGACASRNLAIAAARGQFVTGLDDDDWFEKNRLQVLMSLWDCKYSCLSTNWYIFRNGTYRRNSFRSRIVSYEDICYKNLVGTQFFSLRDRVLKIGGYDESLVASQDYDILIRLIEEYGPAKRLYPALYYFDCNPGRERLSFGDNKKKGTADFVKKHEDRFTKSQKNHASSMGNHNVANSLIRKMLNLVKKDRFYLFESIKAWFRIQ